MPDYETTADALADRQAQDWGDDFRPPKSGPVKKAKKATKKASKKKA